MHSVEMREYLLYTANVPWIQRRETASVTFVKEGCTICGTTLWIIT